ncbi:MAG: nucleoside triphosphate pyrophosphohydrolase [Beijerinckiaceae bacterium]|nr:nucleoside triphosphate pyrophosphohydrolase [Beijerinckiaceae bacterium]
MQPSRDIKRLVEILEALRHPVRGCPWDREQTFDSIVPYTIEEAYEIADAIGRGDMEDFKEELGDLLLQVVFQARIAEEMGLFDFGGVVEAITQKMIRRHPHIFAEPRELSAKEIKAVWETIKADEKTAKNHAARESRSPESGTEAGGRSGLLDGVSPALPGLTRAVKLQGKASTAGFDWNSANLVLDKMREELEEIEAALDSGERDAVKEEIGDLLFAAANLARHTKTDPEAAIRAANAKFERRFRFIEEELGRAGKTAGSVTLSELQALWNMAKQCEA